MDETTPRTAALREAIAVLEAALEKQFIVRNDYDAGHEQGLYQAISLIEKMIT